MGYFSNSRAAVAYCYAAMRGPQAARPRWSDTPRSSGLPREIHLLVGSILFGELQVGHGSELDAELREWALRGGPRTPQVRSVDRRLRKILRERGLLDEPIPEKYRRNPSEGIEKTEYPPDAHQVIRGSHPPIERAIRLKKDWQ